MKLVSALKKYIEMLPGQTLAQFAAEVKSLSDKDRADYKRIFAAEGIEIED